MRPKEVPYQRCPLCKKRHNFGFSIAGKYSCSGCGDCGIHWLNRPEELRPPEPRMVQETLA